MHLGRLYLPSVSDISSEEESEEERTLRWVIALPPIPQPLDLSSHSRKREREEAEGEKGVFLKSEECIFGGKKANLKKENGIGGGFDSIVGKSMGNFCHGSQKNQMPSWVSGKQNAVESSEEEGCTVFLEVDVKKEYMESDHSFTDQSPQIQRVGFRGEEEEKLLKSSPTDSWKSLSPRLQIDLGEENCSELYEDPLVEENSIKSGENWVYANQHLQKKSRGESCEKGANGVFSRLVNDGELRGESRRWTENEQTSHTRENSSDMKRRQTTTAKENYDPGKIVARKSLATEWGFRKEREKRY